MSMHCVLANAACAAAIAVASVFAGDARETAVVVDHNCATGQIEEACAPASVQSSEQIAVRITDASNLAGFMVRLAYDAKVLRFEKADAAGNAGKSALLPSEGGALGPMLVTPKDSTIDIAAAIVRATVQTAPDGDGVLVYCTFKRLAADETSVSIEKVEISDNEMNMETPAVAARQGGDK